ncbi:MAG: zinc ribbon domain-containing protein [Clostridiales bacterium]|nr:zinc ribbon domain-containing protein [Clostridiales bacterium]
MFCNKCGKELNEDVRFCPGCGATVGDAALGVLPPGVQPEQPPPPAYGQPGHQPPPPPAYGQPGHQPPPPAYGQPAGDATLGVPQPGYQVPLPQGHQPPPQGPKKSKAPLFAIGGAAAAVLVFFLVIFPMIGGNGPGIDDDDDWGDAINIEIGVEPPVGRDVPFVVGEAGFSTNDESIKMIEVNQGLSYGFDCDTGELYVMENFVGGKETAIFIDLDKPLDPKSEVKLTVERDGELVATLTDVELVDDSTLLFQPRDISEVGFWDQGAYTLTFTMDDSTAIRTTNFFKSSPLKVLAVPVLGNYDGEVIPCEGSWKTTARLLFATYPVSQAEMEFVLGPELDLSNDRYNLRTDAGQYNVWRAVKDLQTPDNEYTLIVGFVREPLKVEGGWAAGCTYGFPANIVVENNTGIVKTIAHEIAHCYYIGDEYPDGSMNTILNPPPYEMEGHDILTQQTSVGTKEKVVGGFSLGLEECGSLIYPKQRPYWVEERKLIQQDELTSFMGWSTGADESVFWITSDIWNHLLKVFTGQMNGNEPGYAAPDEGQGRYWGVCPNCNLDVYDPLLYVPCKDCFDYMPLTSNPLVCIGCGGRWPIEDYTDDDLYLDCPSCWELIWYRDFEAYNSGDGSLDKMSPEKMAEGQAPEKATVIGITGCFEPGGAFAPDQWFSYQASPRVVTARKGGAYSACVYDDKGKVLSKAYFDAVNKSQATYDMGTAPISNASIPVDVVLEFPENAAKIVIKEGDKEIYSRDVSQSAPTVAFTGLSDGQKLDNNVTLTWESPDAGSGELTYQIWYVRSTLVDFSLMEELFEEQGEEFPVQEDYYEEEEFLVANNVTGTSLAVDLSDYPGTERGWFRILATDGAKTGVGTSAFVEVPWKAPDILNVLPDVTQVKLTDIIEITGKVYDAQDGWLWSKGYEWYIDGEFWHNYGSYYFYQWPYMLKPGMHTITCKATNSAGLSASKDFMFEVIEDESELPDDWSRNDISLALRLGHYFPLNRLDAPVTRIEYAKMMNSLYATAIPDDFDRLPMPDILCEFNDMSNDPTDINYAYAYVMVGLGLMGVENMEAEEMMGITILRGDFNPYGSITEREAMQIFYKTIELAKEQTVATYEVLDEQEFLPTLEEWGLFDEPGGPNVYQAGEKLSKKKTMSRIARFSKFWFELDDKFYGWGEGKTDLE